MKDNRILGFDFLRGLCAIGVAYHHLLHYLGHKDLKLTSVGFYGFYIFFILSGASIYIAYADRIRAGYDLRKFIAQRFFRLVPLFALVVLLAPLITRYDLKGYTIEFFEQAILNITFVFGLADPGTTSIATGGWSLGIEFVFYLLFPVVLAFVSGSAWSGIAFFLVIAALQLMFVHRLITPDGHLSSWTAYTQFLTFAAYFVAGCLIGKFLAATKVNTATLKWQILLWVAFAILVATIALSDGKTSAAPLMSARALGLMVGSITLVLIAGFVKFPARLTFGATALGNLSYGLYLLHPYAYTLATRHFTAHLPENKILCGSLIILAAAVAALIVERFFERPITNFGKQILNRGGKCAQPKPHLVNAEQVARQGGMLKGW